MGDMNFESVVRSVTPEQWTALAQELCRVGNSDASHFSTAFLVCDGESVFVAEPDGIGERPILVLAFVTWSDGDEDWMDVKVSRWWLANLGQEYGGFGGALLEASKEYVPVTDDFDRSYGPRAQYWRERES